MVWPYAVLASADISLTVQLLLNKSLFDEINCGCGLHGFLFRLEVRNKLRLSMFTLPFLNQGSTQTSALRAEITGDIKDGCSYYEISLLVSEVPFPLFQAFPLFKKRKKKYGDDEEEWFGVGATNPDMMHTCWLKKLTALYQTCYMRSSRGCGRWSTLVLWYSE